MSDLFELMQPGLQHWREQQDRDKTLIVEDRSGGSGPTPLDLDSGSVVVQLPPGVDPPRRWPAYEWPAYGKPVSPDDSDNFDAPTGDS